MVSADFFLIHSFIGASLGLVSSPLSYGTALASPGRLYGLLEWRNKCDNDDIADGHEILMLPFAANEALLQGQSTDIILKHGRFFDLFQDCIDNYESIVGMALLGDDDFVRTMPLCQIDDFDVLSGYRGKVTVHVTLRAVARARMTKVSQMQPVVMGFCQELVDLECSDLGRARELVDNIESDHQRIETIPIRLSPSECSRKWWF